MKNNLFATHISS